MAIYGYTSRRPLSSLLRRDHDADDFGGKAAALLFAGGLLPAPTRRRLERLMDRLDEQAAARDDSDGTQSAQQQSGGRSLLSLVEYEKYRWEFRYFIPMAY